MFIVGGLYSLASDNVCTDRVDGPCGRADRLIAARSLIFTPVTADLPIHTRKIDGHCGWAPFLGTR